MKKRIRTIALLLAGCGGHTEAVPSQTPVTQLSPSQEQQLCGWVASLYGGYGGILQCDSGGAGPMGPKSEGDCVQQLDVGFVQPHAKFSHCQATVGQVQACLRWHADNACVASGSPPPSECTIVDGPQCSS
jgi:hypothetical protein